MSTRYYVVESADGKSALIEATSKNAAIRSIAEKRYTCRVASQQDMAKFLAGGTDADAKTPAPLKAVGE